MPPNMECFFLSFRNVLCRFKWKHTLNRSNIIYMDLCFKNDVRENVFAQLAFMCSENLFYIIIHYESHSCSNHQWRWYGCHLSSLKSAFFWQVLHQWIAYNGTETLRPQLKHASPPADQEEGKEMSLIGCRGINIAYSKFCSASSR